MKKAICVLLLLAASSLVAQDKNPVTSAVKEILPRQQKNLVGAADEMPAAKYTYKPTEKQMPFGHLVLHVIQSNYMLCSKVSDTPGKRRNSWPPDRSAASRTSSPIVLQGGSGPARARSNKIPLTQAP